MVNSREGSGSSKVAVVSLEEEGAVGRGEACPTPYFGESVDGVHALIETLLAALAAGEEWDRIHDRTPAGAARNAVDCAVWDLRAKRSGRSVAALMGQPEPVPVPTTYTLGLDSPVAMAAAAKVAGAAHGHLKIKLGAGGDDLARLRAIRDADRKSPRLNSRH